MIILGIICLVLAILLHVHLLWVVGIILLVVGIILLALSLANGPDHRVGGRRYWY